MDMAVVTPVFHDGRLIAFCGSIAHKSDLGGVVPGTGYGSARETLSRGIQYPPVRFIARGEIDARHRGDPARQQPHAGARPGRHPRPSRRRRGSASGASPSSIARYGLDDGARGVRACSRTSPSAASARRCATWPDGVIEAESFVDTDGIDARSARALPRARREDAATASLRLHRLRRSGARADQHPARRSRAAAATTR